MHARSNNTYRIVFWETCVPFRNDRSATLGRLWHSCTPFQSRSACEWMTVYLPSAAAHSTWTLHPIQRCHQKMTSFYSWFQTFAVIWILKMFFWVFPRRQIIVGRRFGTLNRFHLQRLVVDYHQPLKMEQIQGSETSANYKLTPGKYPKEHFQYSNHGESLKSRGLFLSCEFCE